MTLKEYLTKNGITQAAFAASVGRSQVTIARICSGKGCPSLELAVKILRVTDGAVSPQSFIPSSEAE